MATRELIELKRFAEAYREAVATERIARAAVAVDPKYNDALIGATDDLKELSKKVGFLRIEAAGRPEGEVVVAGRAVPVAELSEPIAVDPGEIEVVVRGPGGQQSRKATVAAGAEATVSFAPEPIKDEPTPPKQEEPGGMHPFDGGDGQRLTAIAFGGVGVVGMVLFGVFGGLSQSKFDSLEEQCPNGRCPASLQEDADNGRTYQTVANVSVTIGAIGLAAGAAFLIPTFFMGGEAGGEAKAAVQLQVAPGHVGLWGTFH
jgi:hypothetical protein